jgi:uncharacterized protein YcbK (DUF882 family)
VAKLSMTFLPPPSLQARLQLSKLNRPAGSIGTDLYCANVQGRRTFLKSVSAGVALLSTGASAANAFIFSPQDDQVSPNEQPRFVADGQPLQLGQIPEDFWQKPRELWLRRQGTNQEARIVYWRDGQLVSDGYWQACAMLRDKTANVMTTMDPTILDVLRGITGYYEAWQYHQPIVLTSGFRTLKTNNSLASEGAAKNSMHLYGKAVDLYVPGVPQRDVGILGMHLQQGGVGFYPSKGFTHLDTGKLRAWTGK